MNERSFCGIFRFFFFFFFLTSFFSHKQKFLGSKQAPRYTGKRVILMRVLTRLECTNKIKLTISIKVLKDHAHAFVKCFLPSF